MDDTRGLTWSLLLLGVVVNCAFPPSVAPGLPRYFNVYENTSRGVEIFTLRGVDRDTQDILKFGTIAQDTANLVTLGSTDFNSSLQEWKCKVFLNSILDRDFDLPSRQLGFTLNDGSSTSTVKIIMIIDDVNDNPPTFDGLPYRTSISEDLPIGATVFKVSAKDPDSGYGSVVVFSMKSAIADDNQTFILLTTGSITLNKPLDYSRQSFYHFNVFAKDLGDPPCPGDTCQCNGTQPICNPGPVDLFITITDVQNTPPIFENLPYMGNVKENETVGHSVLQVTAMDGDRGVSPPNKIIYSFTGGDFSHFAINETDGIISIGRTLDADDDNVRDKGGLYVFTVTATEVSQNGSLTSNPTNRTSTVVSITVLDVNDNPPEFSENNFTAVVLENTPFGVPITMTSSIEVSDKDQGINSRFWVYLEKDGAPYLDFDTLPRQHSVILGRSIITIRVLNSSVLDYEATKNITFKVIARENNTDPKISSLSETTVTLQIEDTNDNNPYFPTSQPTIFHVSEDVLIGYVIANVTASDDDSGDFGQITFSLEADGHDGEFNISGWGQIQVAKPLDREQRSLYSLTVVATDSPSASLNQRRRSTLRITINITDVNDHEPVWTQYNPYTSILERTAVGTKVIDIRAVDQDSGENAQIVYSISLGTNGSDLFNITTTSNGAAEINVGQSLIDNFGLRFVHVVAMDMGNPPLNASIGLSIFVIDENQHSPVFVEPDHNNSVSEQTVDEEQPVGSILCTLVATDRDSGQNGFVEYYLNSMPNRDNEYFSVARVNGTLQSERRLDKETKGIYEIQIRAEDNGQPAALTSTLTIRIILRDINDNQPTYRGVKMPQVLHVIEEKNNAYIGQIQPAFDADSFPNNLSCYYLYGNGSSGFYLDKHNGSFFVTDKVDREKTSSLNVVIKASENCNLTYDFYMSVNVSAVSAHNSIKTAPDAYNSSDDSLLWIEVVVDDINDNAPTFLDHDLLASAIFDVEIGTEVLSLATSITDKDTQANSKNMFKLVSITQESDTGSAIASKAFLVSINGSITTNILFESDLLGYFLLRVMAYDDDDLSDSVNVKVFLISNLQRVKLVFNKPVNQVEEEKNYFLKQLSDILNLNILMDKIQSHTNPDGTRDPTKTDAYIHGRYRDTGKVVPASDLWQMLDYSHDARTLLYSYGVTEAKPLTEEEKADETEDLKRIFAILISILAVIVIALILVLIHLVRLYRRRLRAATVDYSPSKEKEILEHPGTNKYLSAKNPLFGQDIKHAAMDEDKTSHNSLDVNEVDEPYSTLEPFEHQCINEEQEMVLQIADSNNAMPTKDVNHSSHLDQVLQAYSNEAYTSDKNVDDAFNPYKRTQNIDYDDFQEGVTRFSDEIMSSDSGYLDTNIQRHLEHTDI